MIQFITIFLKRVHDGSIFTFSPAYCCGEQQREEEEKKKEREQQRERGREGGKERVKESELKQEAHFHVDSALAASAHIQLSGPPPPSPPPPKLQASPSFFPLFSCPLVSSPPLSGGQPNPGAGWDFSLLILKKWLPPPPLPPPPLCGSPPQSLPTSVG